MSDRQPNPADLPAYYQGLRISAQPFVPNVHAMPFQPGSGYPGGQQMYRGGGGGGGMHYAMGGVLSTSNKNKFGAPVFPLSFFITSSVNPNYYIILF